MWQKKTVMIVALLALVLASCFAWPTSGKKAQAQNVVEIKEEDPAEMKSEKHSLVQVEDLQNVVSTTREVLSGSKKLSKEEVEELDQSITDIETGVTAMAVAYKDLAGFHMGIVPTVGYTIGQPVQEAFDFGVSLIANYKNWYATLAANKGLNFGDIKETFKTFNGLRASLGFGFKLF